MDRNTVLAIALSLLVYTTWSIWQQSQHPGPGPVEVVADEVRAEVGEVEAGGERRIAEQVEAATRIEREIVRGTGGDREVEAVAWSREFEMGRYRARLNNRGAVLERWQLADYTLEVEGERRRVDLVGEHVTGGFFGTPFSELGLGDLTRANFVVSAETERGAVFEIIGENGVRVRKEYSFYDDNYGLELLVTVENGSNSAIEPRFSLRLAAAKRAGTDFSEEALAALRAGDVERERIQQLGSAGFIGGLTGRKAGEITQFSGDVQWVAVDNKYFLAAVLPDRIRDAEVSFEPIEPRERGRVVLAFPAVKLPPGQSVEHLYRAYLGPKLTPELARVSDSLEVAIDRGWSWVGPLARLFEWMLNACYSVVPNYGVAIIVLTLLVRLLTMPIMGRQMRSTERMRAIQPLMAELKEKYAGDRQKQSEETMKLYKREGVNPLGGCLPMLLQFPVFIGLFYSLRSAIELRQAPFVGWITDLSAPESLFQIPGVDIPFRVLPLVMGVSMIAQQKLTPTTADPAQAKMMATVMPIMFTVMFYQFPSGLVLYWMISNFLGIGHQLWVGKKMRAAS